MARADVCKCVRELSEWKELVANENSMEHTVALLMDSKCTSNEIVQILGALVVNAQTYADPKWCGRILRPFVRLLSHDSMLNKFVVKCFQSAKGRIVDNPERDFVTCMVECVKTDQECKASVKRALSANTIKFPIEVGFFDLADAFSVWRLELEHFIEQKAAERVFKDHAQHTKENEHKMACEEVHEFVLDLDRCKSLIANEMSMYRVSTLLLESTCSTADKIEILTALLANADKYLDSKWSGRIVRPLVRLLSDDDDLSSFIIECIHEAKGRVLFFETPDELHELIASSKTSQERKEELEHFLKANENKFNNRVGVCDVADGFDTWAGKFKDFFCRKASIDVVAASVKEKQEPLPAPFTVQEISQLQRDNLAPSVKAKFAQKLVDLTFNHVCAEDLDILRGAVVPTLFLLLSEETADFIDAEVKKCTRLVALRKVYQELQRLVTTSKLAQEQQAKLLATLRARYEQADAHADYIKSILTTCLFKEQPMVEFALREIRACRTRIMELVKFNQFAQRLEALSVTGENKARLLQALLENSRQF